MQAASGADEPIFVLLCGCPRSGTTLLAQHFGNALSIATPIETHFIPHFRWCLGLWGDVSEPSRQRNLLSAMAAYTRIWIYRGIRAQLPNRHADISLLPVLEQMETQPVAGGFTEILDTAYRKYAESVAMKYYGDKSSTFDPEDLSLYDRSAKNLKVVHLIRDGRDVYQSWSALWFGPRHVGEAAWLWRRHILTRRIWAKNNAHRYLEVRYEEFVAAPDATLDSIAEFLGISVLERKPAKDLFGSILSNEPTHTKLGEAVNSQNTGRWRETLPANEVDLFEFVAGDTLNACGYPVTSKSRSIAETIVLYARFGLGVVRHFLSINFYLRRARASMPVIFGLMQSVGISVEAVSRSIAGTPSATK